jgi:hypothetical protein
VGEGQAQGRQCTEWVGAVPSTQSGAPSGTGRWMIVTRRPRSAGPQGPARSRAERHTWQRGARRHCSWDPRARAQMSSSAAAGWSLRASGSSEHFPGGAARQQHKGPPPLGTAAAASPSCCCRGLGRAGRGPASNNNPGTGPRPGEGAPEPGASLLKRASKRAAGEGRGAPARRRALGRGAAGGRRWQIKEEASTGGGAPCRAAAQLGSA